MSRYISVNDVWVHMKMIIHQRLAIHDEIHYHHIMSKGPNMAVARMIARDMGLPLAEVLAATYVVGAKAPKRQEVKVPRPQHSGGKPTKTQRKKNKKAKKPLETKDGTCTQCSKKVCTEYLGEGVGFVCYECAKVMNEVPRCGAKLPDGKQCGVYLDPNTECYVFDENIDCDQWMEWYGGAGPPPYRWADTVDELKLPRIGGECAFASKCGGVALCAIHCICTHVNSYTVCHTCPECVPKVATMK